MLKAFLYEQEEEKMQFIYIAEPSVPQHRSSFGMARSLSWNDPLLLQVSLVVVCSEIG